MSQNPCDNLDSFLAEDLPPEIASHFTAHLDECESCREALDQQRWIDGLLRSRHSADLEAPPAALMEHVHQSRLQRRRRLQLIAYGIAAAATLVIAIGWTALANRQAMVPAPIAIHRPADTSTDSPLIPSPPRATFVGGPELLVVPVESPRSNVTIVRVYHTYQPDHAAQASASTPAVPDDLTWPIDLNGG
jgi:hypothetical protein